MVYSILFDYFTALAIKSLNSRCYRENIFYINYTAKSQVFFETTGWQPASFYNSILHKRYPFHKGKCKGRLFRMIYQN